VDIAVLGMNRFQDALHDLLAELGIGWSKLLEPIPAMSPGLSPASGFEHPASTLQTRFPAALGIGHGSALRASLLHSQ